MPGLVDIVTADGQQATVPEENLSVALSSGAHVDQARAAPVPDGGGLLGELATAGLGAGRSASLGFSDAALGEMANLVGGEPLRKDFLHSANLAKQANPYSNMAGEFAGMFVGGPTSIGEGVENAVAEKVGEGLLGKVASFGARGAVEGGLINYQDAVSEATLGDHELNGQKLATHIGEGAMLGGGAGAVLGLGAHGLSSLVEGIKTPRGPMSHAVADEVAGVEGAGKQLLSDSRKAEEMIETLRGHGMTSEQAARTVDETLTMARAKANSGPLSGLVDDFRSIYASKRAGGNQALEDVLADGYAHFSGERQKMVDAIDGHARDLAKATDRMYTVEKAIDSGAYTYKADYMAKLVDASRFDLQRDVLAKLLQDTDEVLKFWESTASKGEAAGAIASLRKQHTDALYALAGVEGRGASAEAARDFFMKADGFKQALDGYSRYGGGRFGAPEAVQHSEMGLRTLGNKWRGALEDVDTWGQAGLAQKEQNAAFSGGKGRGDHFDSLFGDKIDTVAGFQEKTANAGKFVDLLKSLGSAKSDVPLRTVEESIGRLRDRARVGEKWGTLAPEKAAELRAAADDFEKVLGTAKKESEAINRIERMQLEEKDKMLGGLLGLGADLITRPMKTMERLGALKVATKKVEDAISSGMERFFGKSGPEVLEHLAPKPRPITDVAKDIGEVKSLAANPAALDARAREAVGDMAKVAPKTADAAIAAYKRAVLWLAQEAPPATVRAAVLGSNIPTTHYSPQQAHEWDMKRRAAFDARTVVTDMKLGRINRDAIRAIEFVSPQLYMEIQHSAQEWVEKLAREGTLDRMPRAQQASLAALLKVPADETWKPDFMLMMQAAKAMPVPQQGGGGGAPPVAQPALMSKRAIKLNTGAWETEAYRIETR